MLHYNEAERHHKIQKPLAAFDFMMVTTLQALSNIR